MRERSGKRGKLVDVLWKMYPIIIIGLTGIMERFLQGFFRRFGAVLEG